jgi:hypothetical protein
MQKNENIVIQCVLSPKEKLIYKINKIKKDIEELRETQNTLPCADEDLIKREDICTYFDAVLDSLQNLEKEINLRG